MHDIVYHIHKDGFVLFEMITAYLMSFLERIKTKLFFVSATK